MPPPRPSPSSFLLVAVLLFLSFYYLYRSSSTNDDDDESSSIKLRTPRETDDYLDDDASLVDDDRNSLMMRIENEIIAPSRLKGTKALSPGTLLVSTQFRGFFSNGATVLLTEMGTEIYVGYVINKPLPTEEVEAAMKTLRVNTERAPALDEALRSRIFFGSGGPVVDPEVEMWVPIHNHTKIEGGLRLDADSLAGAGDLTIYGDIGELLSRGGREDPFLLLYGRTQWLSGMLEKEIEDGYWIVTKLVRNLGDIYPVRASYFA